MVIMKEKSCKNCTKSFVPKEVLQNCCCYECFMANKNKKAKEKFHRNEMKEEIKNEVSKLAWEPWRPPVIPFKKEKFTAIVIKKPIARVSRTSKNTVRHLDAETIEQVYRRDSYNCIVYDCICKQLDPPHHAFYGAQAHRGPERNDVEELVTLCVDHHYEIHSKGNKALRQYCIDYLERTYGE